MRTFVRAVPYSGYRHSFFCSKFPQGLYYMSVNSKCPWITGKYPSETALIAGSPEPLLVAYVILVHVPFLMCWLKCGIISHIKKKIRLPRGSL